MKKPRNRRFKEQALQHIYDTLRGRREDPDKVRGMGSMMNAYAVGYTRPEYRCPHVVGSRSYAAWAAGVDNAREDAASKILENKDGA